MGKYERLQNMKMSFLGFENQAKEGTVNNCKYRIFNRYVGRVGFI